MSKKCTPLLREAHFEVNMYKTHHFWKLRCRKSARRCGAKHISKSKSTKHTILGPLLEVDMSKKCTPLWREAHFEFKSVKHWRSQTTFGRSDFVSHGRRKGLCTLPKRSKTWGSCSSFNYNHHYTTLRYTTTTTTTKTTTTLHYTTLIKLHYTPLHSTTLPATTTTAATTTAKQVHDTNDITWPYTTLHPTTPHHITLPYITVHYTHYTTTNATAITLH